MGVSSLIALLGSKLIRYVAVKKASSQNLSGMDAFASRANLPQQHGDVFLQNHSVDEHVDMEHDVRCQVAERKN